MGSSGSGEAGQGPTKQELARWSRKKHFCQSRGIPFNLDPLDFRRPSRCPIFPHLVAEHLDRIIPGLGYTKGNVIWVSRLANQIKSNATPGEILAVGRYAQRTQGGVSCL